jgi:hypothetical protein
MATISNGRGEERAGRERFSRAQVSDPSEDSGGGEAGALHGLAVRPLVRRRVEAGAHVQRHEEPAAGAPRSAGTFLPCSADDDGRPTSSAAAAAAAGGHH